MAAFRDFLKIYYEFPPFYFPIPPQAGMGGSYRSPLEGFYKSGGAFLYRGRR